MAFTFPPTHLRPIDGGGEDADLRANARWLLDEHFEPLIRMLAGAVDAHDLQAARILAGDLVESAAGLELLLRRA